MIAQTKNAQALVEATRQILKEAGVQGGALSVLHHTDPIGYRPDVLVHVDAQTHPHVLDYLAAWHGLLQNHKATVAFNAHPRGPDTLHYIETNEESKALGDMLRKAGVPRFSVHKGRAYIFDKGSQLDLSQVAGEANGRSYHAVRGVGRILGAGKGSDADARQAYREALQRAEARAASATSGTTKKPDSPVQLSRVKMARKQSRLNTVVNIPYSHHIAKAIDEHMKGNMLSHSDMMNLIQGHLPYNHPIHDLTEKGFVSEGNDPMGRYLDVYPYDTKTKQIHTRVSPYSLSVEVQHPDTAGIPHNMILVLPLAWDGHKYLKGKEEYEGKLKLSKHPEDWDLSSEAGRGAYLDYLDDTSAWEDQTHADRAREQGARVGIHPVTGRVHSWIGGPAHTTEEWAEYHAAHDLDVHSAFPEGFRIVSGPQGSALVTRGGIRTNPTSHWYVRGIHPVTNRVFHQQGPFKHEQEAVEEANKHAWGL